MNSINSITVVGGGTSGCIAALILKTKFPQKTIQIVESTNVGIIGVGESTTEHWSEFCRFVGISQLSSILEANATFKIGIRFKNWSKNDFLHCIDPRYNVTDASYYYKYAYIISSNQLPQNMQTPKCWANEVSLSNFKNLEDSPTNQYHFDTFALNEFLHQECLKRNIEIIQDDIIGVDVCSETGNVKVIKSKTNQYYSDFFIDCSGFSRLLMQKTYNIGWKSYSEYLPLNSAIAFPTEEMEEYNKYTLSTARNAGWSWTIPTQTRTGNGYVYCDHFIDKDKACQEMKQAYGKDLEIAKEFKFDPGRLEKAWYKNCYAVGLSQSFIEPLEATSIGSVVQQMFCFIHYLPSFSVEDCNSAINKIFDNMVDYVQAHYLTKKEDTKFWKEIKYNLKLTSNLQNYLKLWENRLPLDIDINCPWGLFKSVNYIPLLHGLDWFDKEKIKFELLNHGYDEFFEKNLQTIIDQENDYENSLLWVSHKKMIRLLKNN